MARVTGIGGLFVRAADPARLSRWYEERLGVTAPPVEYGLRSWWQEAGPTVLAPMDDGAGHLASGRGWALNLRVDDLDGMVEQLRAAGVVVAVHEETYPNGRFADLEDPEGNQVQLWQPSGADLLPPG